MLTKERSAAVLSILQKQRTITALELTQALSISESTIQRDLVALYRMGKLKEVHGSATLLHKGYGLYETEAIACSEGHAGEKKRIARYVTSLVQAHDFACIDIGSITLHMVEYLKEEEAIYVTNRSEHRRRLATQGLRILLLAGELKSKTEAVVGPGAVSSPQKYNSNKTLFGTNGIAVDSDSAAPDTSEAYVKMEAIKHAQECYVFADLDKFGACISITTADVSNTTIITGKGVEREYLEETGMVEVEE